MRNIENYFENAFRRLNIFFFNWKTITTTKHVVGKFENFFVNCLEREEIEFHFHPRPLKL